VSTLVFLDIETTGLDVERHEIWEVAVIIEDTDPGKRSAVPLTKQWHLPVFQLGTADPDALKLSGFYERHPAGKSLSCDPATSVACNSLVFAREFEELTRGATLVGANVRFDESFLTRFLKASNTAPSWYYRLCDVEAMAQGVLRNPLPMGLVNSSKELSRRLGILLPERKAHSAMDDALLARDVYYMVVNQRLMV
jgi:DNA polymerase III epsilon subunit-like protein